MQPSAAFPFVQARSCRRVDDRCMAIDITALPIHLGPGGTARVVEGFDWSPERLAEYERATRADGPDGRMVMMFEIKGEWSSWERHPAGAEVVIACTGTHRFVQELTTVPVGRARRRARPGRGADQPARRLAHRRQRRGGWIVTITPGLGTEHRPLRLDPSPDAAASVVRRALEQVLGEVRAGTPSYSRARRRPVSLTGRSTRRLRGSCGRVFGNQGADPGAEGGV